MKSGQHCVSQPRCDASHSKDVQYITHARLAHSTVAAIYINILFSKRNTNA